MYQQPIFLKPVFKDRIWGGTKLRDAFQYEISTELTGECWGISAHPHGSNEILNGPLKGVTLQEAWQKHRELFSGLDGEEFPLLTKILDASDDLSVQVHPDDTYAKEVENYPFGKTECWYIIDCVEGAELVYGHHAQSKEEFQQLVEQGSWEKLLRRVKVKPGDFYYIPSGTIHAIGKGIMVLETQQSSDITYRVYDYDRRDAEGNLRELHIDHSIVVAATPHQDIAFDPVTTEGDGYISRQLVAENYFTVYHLEVKGVSNHRTDGGFYLMSVLEGEGQLRTSEGTFVFKKGDHFIVPSTLGQYELEGSASLIVSHPTVSEKKGIKS
jgi:mannose-6-phosphate isomerase